jgi:hypothetical protein
MPVRVVTSRAQQPITVNALIKNPLIVPERIVGALDNQFAMDRILRDAGRATGGAVMFRVSAGLFADSASEIVPEGGEIPLVTRTRGDIDSKPVAKRALGVEITREMRERNAVGEVSNQITVLRNTLIRDVDGAFVATLRAAVTQTRAATAAWSSASATIRKDINAAKLLVSGAQAPGTTGGNNFMGFQADSIVFNPNTEANLLNSTEFLNVILGSTAATNVDSLPARILGLRPSVTWGVPDGEAWVMQSGVVGGYADEILLEATELYYWQPRQAYRSDTTRSTVGFIDQPLAAARITGV